MFSFDFNLNLQRHQLQVSEELIIILFHFHVYLKNVLIYLETGIPGTKIEGLYAPRIAPSTINSEEIKEST